MGRIEAVRTAAAVDRRTAERNMAAVGLWSVGGSVVWRGTTGGQRRLELARRGVGRLKLRSQKSKVDDKFLAKRRMQAKVAKLGKLGWPVRGHVGAPLFRSHVMEAFGRGTVGTTRRRDNGMHFGGREEHHQRDLESRCRAIYHMYSSIYKFSPLPKTRTPRHPRHLFVYRYGASALMMAASSGSHLSPLERSFSA